ncbi:uncharacterized protein LOC125073577 [Vanessa atalanta]|uniref:uncharacterized protein LOC125073577 n=1 Tax=Vanessa atalanta TaxID=42275 RepID=UPI001FCDA115|nr:uncharacterized protein LOC125073577 [Vanessa atalanta]
MNKFFMNQLSEPNSYLSDIVTRKEQKSLQLYFIGPFTSLIMKSKKMRYHYFINPPSPLPSWFYGEHKYIVESNNKKYVEIPVGVQIDFLKKLLNLLKIYIGFPV